MLKYKLLNIFIFSGLTISCSKDPLVAPSRTPSSQSFKSQPLKKLVLTAKVLGKMRYLAIKKREDRKNLISGLKKGFLFDGPLDRYYILPEVFACEDSLFPFIRELHLKEGRNIPIILEKKGKFTLFQSSSPSILDSIHSKEVPFSKAMESIYQVALNERNHELGIVLNTLKLTLNNLNEVESLSKKFSIRLLGSIPFQNLALFRVPIDRPIIDLYKEIKESQNKTKVRIDVLENFISYF